MPHGPIIAWSKEDKVTETIQRSKKHFGPALQHQVDALLTPENLAILVGTLVIWAASHFVGVGEIVDVALLLIGAVMLGPAIVDVAENLLKFGKCIAFAKPPAPTTAIRMRSLPAGGASALVTIRECAAAFTWCG